MRALPLAGPAVRFPEQENDVVGEELAVEREHRLGIALLLVEKLLKLAEKIGQAGAQTLGPGADMRFGSGQKSHEDVGAAKGVPTSLACQPNRLPNRGGRRFFEQLEPQVTSRGKNVFHAAFRRLHNAALAGEEPPGH